MAGLAGALLDGETELGGALLAAAPRDRRLHAPYRILGDPLALLAASATGAQRATRVFAPAAEELAA